MSFRGWVLTVALAAPLGGCYFTTASKPDPTVQPRMEMEWRTAVSRPGAKVCRRLTAGIAERDWVTGTVIEVGPSQVGVRIDDPGRFRHSIDGVDVARGGIIRSNPLDWTPCL